MCLVTMPPPPPPLPSQFATQLRLGRRRLRKSAPRPPPMPRGFETVLGLPVDGRRRGSKQIKSFFTKSGQIKKSCKYGIPPCTHGSVHYSDSGRVCCRPAPRGKRSSKRRISRRRSSRRRVSRRKRSSKRRVSRRRVSRRRSSRRRKRK